MSSRAISGTRRSFRAPGTSAWIGYLLLFQLIYVVSYVDRQAISLVVDPIKAAFGASDGQIGLLQGVAFSAVLAVAALVTATLVDRVNRVRLVALCMMAWCLMTVGCGFAQSFAALLVFRVGLAFAEAAVPTAAISLLCDVAPPKLVPRAIALFIGASYVGSGLALILGGAILDALAPLAGGTVAGIAAFQPWRGLFVAIGVPGLLIALLVLLFVREPARLRADTAQAASASVLPYFRDNAALFAALFTMTACFALAGYTIYAWIPTLMMRHHGFDPAQVGRWIGLIFLLCGIAGSVFGSWIMTPRDDRSALLHVVGTLYRLSFLLWPAAVATVLVGSAPLAILLLCVTFFLTAVQVASVMAPVGLLAPPHLRGRVVATASFVNAAGGGLGPYLVGLVTDSFDDGGASLAVSLSIVFAAVALLSWIAGAIALGRIRRIAPAGDRGGTAGS